MLLARLNDAVTAALAERGADHRTVHTRTVALPPDGSVVELETSDASLAADVTRRLDLTGADVGVLRVTTLPAAGLPERLVPISGIADVRRSPSHHAELVSQALCGDALEPLKAEGDWYLVRMDDGYLGWIRTWHLAAASAAQLAAFARRARHRVDANYAAVSTAPEAGARPVTHLVVGTGLVAAPGGRRGWLAVELADGRRGFMRAGDVARCPRRHRLDGAALAATGLRFLGIPYLWGGTTPLGFDCSGLVQRIYRLHGAVLPRDSDMQCQFGKERPGIPEGAGEPGDLLFFGSAADRITHVGMALPDGTFLHAYGQVIVSSLDPRHPLHLPAVARIFRSRRAPFPRG